MSTKVIGTEQTAGLLDILIVVSESWKLLVSFPFLVALLAFGTCELQTPTYQSKATLLMFHTDDGLVIPHDLTLRALKTVSGTPDADRILAGLVLGKPVHQTGRVSLVPVALTLPGAKSSSIVLNAILAEYQSQFLDAIKSEYKSAYQDELNIVQQEISGRAKAIDRIEKLLEHDSAAPPVVSSTGSVTTIVTSLISLTSGLEERERKRAELIRQLNLLPKSVIVARPTAPVLVYGPNTPAAVLFAMLGAEMVALVFAFLRDLVRRQATLPGGAEKIARLRRALGLHRLAPTDPAGCQ